MSRFSSGVLALANLLLIRPAQAMLIDSIISDKGDNDSASEGTDVTSQINSAEASTSIEN